MRVSFTQILRWFNQISIWLSQPSQKIGSAYKISTSVVEKQLKLSDLCINITPNWLCHIPFGAEFTVKLIVIDKKSVGQKS